MDEVKPVDFGRLHPQEGIPRVERIHEAARPRERPAVLRSDVVPERRTQVDPLAGGGAHGPLVVETIALERAPPREKARAERKDDPQDRKRDESLDEEDSPDPVCGHARSGQRIAETSFLTALSAASSAACACLLYTSDAD